MRISCSASRTVSALVSALLLSACASTLPLPDPPTADAITTETEHQRSEALVRQHAREYRLARVARPLLIAAARDLCPVQQRSDYGLRLHSIASYAPSRRDAARTLYTLDRQPMLRTPVPGSPAARAGLRAGDRLLRLQGRSIEDMDTVDETLHAVSGPLSLELARGDALIAVKLWPDTLCDWPIRLSRSSVINAYADGKQVRVTQAMLAYAQEDNELALVIAHELAHNGLQHIDKQLQNLLLGALLDLLALTQGYPSPGIGATLGVHHRALRWELEADLQALVLLHRAGYALAPGVEFWRRLGTDFPASIRHTRGLSHPGTAERYLRMKAAAQALRNMPP